MSLRHRLIRLAYLNADLRREVLPMLVRTAEAAPEEEESSSGGGVSGRFLQFLKEEGSGKIRNPDTGNQVMIKSLKGPKGKPLVQKLFQEWLKAQEGKDKPKPKSKPKADLEPENKPEPKPEPKAPASKGFPKLKLEKDRYKGKLKATAYVSLKAKGDPQPGKKAQEALAALRKVGKVTEETLADVIGGPVLMGNPGDYRFEVSNSGEGLNLSMRGPHIRAMDRRLMMDDDGPYIYNESLVLSDDAPKGLGTRIFAAQVAQAREAGIKKIKCNAFRNKNDPTWVGYKVWPKLGYDGVIPFDGPADPDLGGDAAPPLPKALLSKIKKAGFKEPYMVSHLYRVDGGQEWWEENGVNFHAEFDLADGSTSMKVLGEYLEAKAAKAKQDPAEWMMKAAAKKKDKDDADEPKDKGKKQHENLALDKDDDDLLAAIWKKYRK